MECRFFAAAAVAMLSVLAPSAHAARPMVTDDARIVDAKACQLETWVRRSPGPGTTEWWALPACNPTDNLEITVGGAHTWGGDLDGLTDKVVQAKTLFRTFHDGWGVGLAVGTDVHPKRSVSRAWPGNPYAYVPLTFAAAGDAWTVHVNGGATRDRDAGRTVGTWGVGNEVQIDESLYAIGEAFASDRGRPFYQLGLRRWIVKDRVQLDATYGNRFEPHAGERWFTIGLRLLSPPFLP